MAMLATSAVEQQLAVPLQGFEKSDTTEAGSDHQDAVGVHRA